MDNHLYFRWLGLAALYFIFFSHTWDGDGKIKRNQNKLNLFNGILITFSARGLCLLLGDLCCIWKENFIFYARKSKVKKITAADQIAGKEKH